jgi:hypothetical protein
MIRQKKNEGFKCEIRRNKISSIDTKSNDFIKKIDWQVYSINVLKHLDKDYVKKFI